MRRRRTGRVSDVVGWSGTTRGTAGARSAGESPGTAARSGCAAPSGGAALAGTGARDDGTEEAAADAGTSTGTPQSAPRLPLPPAPPLHAAQYVPRVGGRATRSPPGQQRTRPGRERRGWKRLQSPPPASSGFPGRHAAPRRHWSSAEPIQGGHAAQRRRRPCGARINAGATPRACAASNSNFSHSCEKCCCAALHTRRGPAARR